MYLSEQLTNPDERRLRLSTQLGVQHVVIDQLDPRPAAGIASWDTARLTDYRRWVEGFGLRLDVLALDVGSVLVDSLTHLDAARVQRAVVADNIQRAADAGIDCLSYHLQFTVAGQATRPKPGRGGVLNPAFVLAEGQSTGPRDRPLVDGTSAWNAIEFLMEKLVPAADAAGVRLACVPQVPAYLPGGLNGVEHVMGSPEGLRRFLALSPSRNHGLDFCQRAVAGMFAEPAKALIPVIEEFASTGRLFLVRFNNIRGGFMNFEEVFPDEGDLDMFQALKAYQRGGYAGPVCPEPSPMSELDPEHERFDAFALGYARGLLQAAGVRTPPGH